MDGPAIEDLREAVAARDELISVVGHEIRNTMAPLVLLAAHFEALPAADDMMRTKIAMLTRNLNAFIGTLDRIGEVASLRDGKLVLALVPVDLQDVVREVVTEHTGIAAAAGCELVLDTTSLVGQWDRARLKQIVGHLVSNAIRHGRGPVEISVREHGSLAEIVVQDAGPGIPVAERARLFDRFERKGNRHGGGLGIGLWVTKTLCQALGGTVRLDDGGCGARFVVALPRG